MDWENDEDADLQRALAMSLQEAPPTPPPSLPPASYAYFGNHNFGKGEDDELAKALAMSLEPPETSPTCSRSSHDPMDMPVEEMADSRSAHPLHSSSSFLPIPPSPIDPVDVSTLSGVVKEWFQTATPANISSAQELLWDPLITVENDQRRWLAQPIAFKSTLAGEAPQTQTQAHAQAQAQTQELPGLVPMESDGATPALPAPTTTGDDILLDSSSSSSSFGTLLDHPDRWGLVQAHGGPCGVLASVQAELLRRLLFGTSPTFSSTGTPQANEKEKDNMNDNGHSNESTGKVMPIQSSADSSCNNNESAQDILSPSSLQACMALSMGTILARAALQPNAASGDPIQHPHHPPHAGIDTTMTHHNTEKDIYIDAETGVETPRKAVMTTPSVQLIFPKQQQQQQTSSADNINHNAKDDSVSTQFSHLEWNHFAPWNPTVTNAPLESNLLVSYTISMDATNNNNNNSHTMDDALEQETTLLAQAVATFLLETKQWQWYTRQGGVLLFVMALIQSRTCPMIQSDMDDAHSKLTSQFGYCSQELLNLLLTGQAVSNVFDHTLRPSGDLICRGIQKRPAIGYLTLLESMRYVHVGSYYKRPQFPIWVIGSTSHFTVLFADDASCLQESKSDQILESVRRAFQQMDGAEEQGFIKLNQLDDFLRRLDLYDRLGESGVQTLGATLEVHGAGILLWEDVWKRTSRLLTGASLQAVLDSDDIFTNYSNDSGNDSELAVVGAARTSSVAFAPPTTITVDAAAEVPLSDEEYARQLHAEWNEQINPSPMPLQKQPPIQPQMQQQQPLRSRLQCMGKKFQLYHYNGLRGGTKKMRPFCVTPLSSQEVIGTSVPLSGVSRQPSYLMDENGGLLDVLRTKWPACRIDWLSGSPPSID